MPVDSIGKAMVAAEPGAAKSQRLALLSPDGDEIAELKISLQARALAKAFGGYEGIARYAKNLMDTDDDELKLKVLKFVVGTMKAADGKDIQRLGRMSKDDVLVLVERKIAVLETYGVSRAEVVERLAPDEQDDVIHVEVKETQRGLEAGRREAGDRF